jgi:flagellar biosynthesis/type III secretory pathway protein FliH
MGNKGENRRLRPAILHYIKEKGNKMKDYNEGYLYGKIEGYEIGRKTGYLLGFGGYKKGLEKGRQEGWDLCVQWIKSVPINQNEKFYLN